MPGRKGKTPTKAQQSSGKQKDGNLTTYLLRSSKDKEPENLEEGQINMADVETARVCTEPESVSNSELKQMILTLGKDFQSFRLEIQQEIKTEVKKIAEKGEEVEKLAKHTSDRIDDMEQKVVDKKYIEGLLRRIEQLESYVLSMDYHDRKYNLIFFGIPVKKNDVYETLREFLEKALEIPKAEVQRMEICNAHVLGDEDPTTGRPPPIMARFVRWPERERVLDMTYQGKLNNTKQKIVTDLPVSMKQQRSRLESIGYTLRHEKNLKTRIRVKKLTVRLEYKEKAEGSPWKTWREG